MKVLILLGDRNLFVTDMEPEEQHETYNCYNTSGNVLELRLGLVTLTIGGKPGAEWFFYGNEGHNFTGSELLAIYASMDVGPHRQLAIEWSNWTPAHRVRLLRIAAERIGQVAGEVEGILMKIFR